MKDIEREQRLENYNTTLSDFDCSVTGTYKCSIILYKFSTISGIIHILMFCV